MKENLPFLKIGVHDEYYGPRFYIWENNERRGESQSIAEVVKSQNAFDWSKNTIWKGKLTLPYHPNNIRSFLGSVDFSHLVEGKYDRPLNGYELETLRGEIAKRFDAHLGPLYSYHCQTP